MTTKAKTNNPPNWPVFDEAVLQFVADRKLEDDFAWLCTVAPSYFEDSDLKIHVMYGEDEDDVGIDLAIYDSVDLKAFTERMHAFYERIRKEGRKELYRVFSMTHWRRRNIEWQVVPGDSAAPS